jgi:flagellar motor switch protein FliG
MPIWCLFVVLFPLIGLAFLTFGVRTGRKAARLLADGMPSVGTRIREEATNVRINNRTVMKYFYEFPAEDGNVYEATASTPQADTLAAKEQPLLYNPANPGDATLIAHLPYRPQVDELGQFKPVSLGRLMLTKAYGREKADEILERLRRRERLEHPFGFLEKRPGSVVYRLLARESASVCALVLAFMPPALASDVLGRLEPELMLETVKRLASLGSPNETVLQSVAQELRARLATAESVPTSTDPSLRKKQIAEVLKFSRPEIESSVLEGLHNEDEMVAAEIREFLFSWGDLAGVDKRAMAKILSTVDTRTLSIALKGSAPDVEENIMNNLSARVRAMVAEERDLAGPMPMTEVVLARTEMLNSVRALIESGEMQPQKAGEALVN